MTEVQFVQLFFIGIGMAIGLALWPIVVPALLIAFVWLGIQENAKRCNKPDREVDSTPSGLQSEGVERDPK